ncbi:hypothetical protein MSAN_01704400 [Mycena sanguinolenta]|uniref:F-box domain-containing protein n=1 Tax=Mycena sanguinolenta TaxID=230812 RepID=A0A8H6XZ59_9AGAR|nr:hypothetical protein MSAN_01704400 [Mycena sanguinolenta]
MPSAGILDLPTEILLNVFGGVEDESLYHLALLCRRLNLIALPIYFSRRNVDLESESGVACTLGGLGRWDILPALQISLFIQSLEHLHCSIAHHTIEPSITPFLRHIKRLEIFISRLSSVKKVSLHLASHDANWSMSLKTGNEVCAWSSHVGNLLNCIVQRECQYLSITDGSYIEPYRPSLTSRFTRRLVRRPIRSMPFPSVPTHLTTLVLDSATLLTLPTIDWVLGALRQSPVNKLALVMQRGDAELWGDVLPRFATAARCLTDLSLTEVPLDAEVVVLSVLDRFSLTDLYISSQQRLPDDSPRGPLPALRDVARLGIRKKQNAWLRTAIAMRYQ